jgi:predicted amidophosphoribosyltransferase
VFSLSEIIFPSRCIGCSTLGISICSECRQQWHPHFYQREILCSSEEFPVFSSIQYSPIASRVLLSAKESQLRAADQLLIAGMVHALNLFVNRYGSATLVPIPSRKSATRKRGRNFLQEITLEVAKKTGLPYQSLLSHNRKVRDQSNLSLLDRSRNVSGSFSVSRDISANISLGNIGPKIIVIDDLITTGATLGEAFRALRTAGFSVLGAVTSCTAQPLR